MKIPGVIELSPPVWASTGHLQTIASHIIPSDTYKKPLEEVTIPLPDGDGLKAYLQQGTSDTVVSVYHGLSGNVESDYMQRTAILCEKLGHGFLLVNLRGSHTGISLAKKIYHSGRGEDVSQVLRFLRQRFPNKKQITIGISLGGAIVLNLLSGRYGSDQPDAAITVNAPLDLNAGARKLGQGLNRIYDYRFVSILRKDVQMKYELGLLPAKVEIPRFATTHDFDEIFTGPMSEFGNRDDYYRECSVKGHLGKIKVPLIMLHAADDPFVSVQDYINEHTQNPNPMIEMHIENSGGHVGYLSAKQTELGNYRWLDYFLKIAIERQIQKMRHGLPSQY